MLASVPVGATPLPAQALITAVEVLPDTPMKAVVVIGDSRVDGTGSTQDAD